MILLRTKLPVIVHIPANNAQEAILAEGCCPRLETNCNFGL